MIGVTLRTFLPGQFIQIKSALEHAVRALPKAERIPSVKACLADRILTLSTSGETDPSGLAKSPWLTCASVVSAAKDAKA